MSSEQGPGRGEPGGVTGPEPHPGWSNGPSAAGQPAVHSSDESTPGDPTPDEPPRRGRISHQDETTAPREPTLAEQRAHQQREQQSRRPT